MTRLWRSEEWPKAMVRAADLTNEALAATLLVNLRLPDCSQMRNGLKLRLVSI